MYRSERFVPPRSSSDFESVVVFERVLPPAHVSRAFVIRTCPLRLPLSEHIRGESTRHGRAHTTPAVVRPSRKSTPDGYRVSSRRRFACTCANYRRRTARKPLFPRAFPGSILRPVYTRRRRRLLVRFTSNINKKNGQNIVTERPFVTRFSSISVSTVFRFGSFCSGFFFCDCRRYGEEALFCYHNVPGSVGSRGKKRKIQQKWTRLLKTS